MPQAYSQKYTIVCFFYPLDAPATFSALDWPLHVTMLDTFKTNWSVVDLLSEVRQVAATTAPFSALPVEQHMLGPNKDVPVKLLQKDAAMLGLHDALLALADKGSLVFNSPEFVGQGFLPHATDQKNGQLELSRTYAITTMSLVDMFPSGDCMQRDIIKTFALEAKV